MAVTRHLNLQDMVTTEPPVSPQGMAALQALGTRTGGVCNSRRGVPLVHLPGSKQPVSTSCLPVTAA